MYTSVTWFASERSELQERPDAMRHHCMPIFRSQDYMHIVGICQRKECTLLLPTIGSHQQNCISSTYQPLPSTNQPNHPLVGLPMHVPACSPTNPPTDQPTFLEHLNASAPLVSVGGRSVHFSCQLLPRIEQKVRLRQRDFVSRGVIDQELRAEDFYKQGVIDKDTRQSLSNFSSVSLFVHLLVCPRGFRPACMT